MRSERKVQSAEWQGGHAVTAVALQIIRSNLYSTTKEHVMTIDKSGEYWVGSDVNDIKEFLVAFTEDGYPIDEFRSVKCDCGNDVFLMEADFDQGMAQRTCAKCKKQHLMCDSAEYWDESEPEEWSCACNSNKTNIGVGFALRPHEPDEEPDVKWIYVGCRCSKCGTLGCFVDWKIDYGPSVHLLDQV